MKKAIIIKYGELSTKSDNINFFLKTLKTNIEGKIQDFNYEIKYDYGRMIIFTNNLEEVQEKLHDIFGIHEICIGYIISKKDINVIGNTILELIKERTFNTFKVIAKRSDKKFPIKSPDIARNIGAIILKNTDNKKVDVHNPDLNINVEIRLNEVLIYFDGIKGLGGYPVSSLGKGLLMLSGGIDSPVAGYLAIKRGVKIEAIYFDSPPHTSVKALEKVKKLASKLARYNNGSVKLHIINFTKIQEEIIKNIPNEYLITIMRRMMYQISAILSSNINAHVIINGESIGQVASQTLKSMEVINESIKKPVIRPLATYDKLEIMDLARRIDTYDISIEPYEDCCTIFVPKHPVIHPDLKKVYEYEKLVNFKDLIFSAVKSHEIVVVNEDIKETAFNELL